MASPPPFSPPPASSASSVPISPVSRSSTFPHKTSPAVVSHTPLIDMNTPAINAAPVELDGVPMAGITSPGDEGDKEERFLSGEATVGRGEQRAAMLASRSKDPGVIVDVPQEPTAEEVEAAKSADGSVTPGVGAGREVGA
ncbi:hypothetical protein DE146DRAFT_303271 [Phaeosphaeria sp. MPI-PUGE-AT-0046c]|nr:hypothetical protein DE146DRAFT_303271 [Phaeosphaeria sp. MPI-PUGE-AT-0046c]